MFPSSLPVPRLPSEKSIPVLRWGIIGPGWIAEHFARALKAHTGQQLVAVSARNKVKAQAFAERWAIPAAFSSTDEMLAMKDLDAIYIATPHNHHLPDGMKALNAGKHVLIEKPLALNVREAETLQAKARQKGLLCMEGMWCDFAPKYDVLRQLLNDGVMGDLHTLTADHGEFFTQDHRIFNADLAGGPMLDLGSYLVSLSVMVAGAPVRIQSCGQPAEQNVNGQASMLFEHTCGMHSVLNTTLFSNTPGSAVIAGRNATLVLAGQFYAPGGFVLTSSQGGHTLCWEETASRYAQLCHEIRHFSWCVGQGLNDSPVRPLSAVLNTLKAMDTVRGQLGIIFNEEH